MGCYGVYRIEALEVQSLLYTLFYPKNQIDAYNPQGWL